MQTLRKPYTTYLHGHQKSAKVEAPASQLIIPSKLNNCAVINVKRFVEGNRAILTLRMRNGRTKKVYYPSGFSCSERLCPGCKKPLEKNAKRHGKYHWECFQKKLVG